MERETNRNSLFRSINRIDRSKIKFRAPLILKMYDALNQMNLKSENRYIICNFIDQNSDIMNIKGDIYTDNNDKNLNQLILYAIIKAKENNLLHALYDEYFMSFKAITEKIDLNTAF